MTDEQKILGLIPAKALGCLDLEDNLTIQSFIDQGFDFPWDELGKYQYVASLLPLALQLEIPEPQLKDNVALKLIKLSEELRAKKNREEEALALNKTEETIDNITDDNIVSDNLVDEQTPVKNDELFASFNLDKITLPEADAPEPFTISTTTEQEQELNEFPSEEIQLETIPVEKIDLSRETIVSEEYITPEISEGTKTASITEDQFSFNQPAEEKVEKEKIGEEEEPLTASITQVEEKRFVEESLDTLKTGDSGKKSINEKMFKALEQDFDSLKSSLAENEKRFTKNMLMAYVAIAVLLALLIFSFFKFSSDIKSLENEVKDLKKKLSSELIIPTEINSDFFFHS